MDYSFLHNTNFFAEDGLGGWTPIRPSFEELAYSTSTTTPDVAIDWGDHLTALSNYRTISLRPPEDPYTSNMHFPDILPLITLCDGENIHMPQTPYLWDDAGRPLGGILIAPKFQCFIKCTPLMKETIMRLAERSWDRCPFIDGCKSQDEYNCRKCLERRIKWNLVD